MNLVDRAKNIILRPKEEWQVIDTETTDIPSLYKSYIVPLAAIPVIGGLIGMSLVGMPMPFAGGTYHMPFGAALGSAVARYVLTLVGVYIVALIINALAPSFSGEKNLMQALKVTTYAYTPTWLAGIFLLIPWLGILSLLASLYGLYLLYLGLPVLMKSPPDRALGYTAVVVISVIVVFVIIGAISAAFLVHPGGMPMQSFGPSAGQ